MSASCRKVMLSPFGTPFTRIDRVIETDLALIDELQDQRDRDGLRHAADRPDGLGGHRGLRFQVRHSLRRAPVLVTRGTYLDDCARNVVALHRRGELGLECLGGFGRQLWRAAWGLGVSGAAGRQANGQSHDDCAHQASLVYCVYMTFAFVCACLRVFVVRMF